MLRVLCGHHLGKLTEGPSTQGRAHNVSQGFPTWSARVTHRLLLLPKAAHSHFNAHPSPQWANETPYTQREMSPTKLMAQDLGPISRLYCTRAGSYPSSSHTTRPPLVRPLLTCLPITQPLLSPPALPTPSLPPKSNTPTAQSNLIKIRKKFAFSFHCTPSNHRSSSNFENLVPLLIISLILHFKAQRQTISLVVY